MAIILHHYPYSPFAEKIRAMLGYSQLDWCSCLTDEAPPRDKLMLLSGGYNRIPILQIGADIFCDSNLIAEELSSVSGNQQLSSFQLDDDQKARQRTYETKLFFACINKGFSLKLLARLAKENGVFNLLRFLKDRVQMGKTASISMGSPKSSAKNLAKYSEELETILADHLFIGGEQPNILDFSVYHCFWFAQYVGRQSIFKEGSGLTVWYDKMSKFSSQARIDQTIDESLQVAKNAQPRELSSEWITDERIGKLVSISPSDYRKDPIRGKLVAVSQKRYILERETTETGRVNVHIPIQHYTLEMHA
jgi:glutathione S-transferase